MRRLIEKLVFIFIAIVIITSFILFKPNKDNDLKECVKSSNDTLVLVNRRYYLPKDYIPNDLIVPNIKFSSHMTNEEKKMRKDAAKALEDMFKEAKNDEIFIYGLSGYRSYKSQVETYNQRVERVGRGEADKYVASPGHSEHQTGLAIDITNKAGGGNFGKSKEGKWLKSNADKFGFIIRYPKEKERITGYNYEPWHIRYVGKKAANEIKSKNLVLEEYLEK